MRLSRLLRARPSNCLLVRNGHLAHHSSESEMCRTYWWRHDVCPSQVASIRLYPLKYLPGPSLLRVGRVGGAQ